MTSPKIIALTGLPGSGKSEVRKVLESLGYYPIRIAQPIKCMALALGLTTEQIEGSLKEKPSFILNGATPRKLLQVLGRELPDALGTPDLYARIWASTVQGLGHPKIVVEDHRYAYEANWFHGVGHATVWKVDRAGHKPDAAAMTHTAENQHLDYDDVVFNSGSLEHLRNEVIRMEKEAL